MTIDNQLRRLDKNVGEFRQCLFSLGERMFLMPIGRWSPRDIVAHLVGWNRHMVEGADQIRRGELPFYDIDPGDDYSKVNAVLIGEYPSTSKQELLDDLRASTGELEQFLRSLPPDEWDRDFGVRHAGATVTIRNSVDDLIDDYEHHREQIVTWRDARTREQ